MNPLVSIVLPVKNGLPHLTSAIDAIRRQRYDRYELIVQDGGSTDGTLAYLSSLTDFPPLALVSEPDRGIGQAYSRALRRCSGDLVCFAAADETLEPDAIDAAVRGFTAHPDAVVVLGSVRMTSAQGDTVEIFRPPHFDLIAHLRGEVVLPFSGLFDRRRIGDDFYYDESLKTCPDYDFWIRLGSRFEPRQFAVVTDVFKSARADRASMSFRPESFEQFCRDKVSVLNRFLDAQPKGPVIDSLRRSATSGIYLWAAEQVYGLDGRSPAFLHWCREAAVIDPWAPRLLALAVRTGAFLVDERGQFVAQAAPQPNVPATETTSVAGSLATGAIFSLPHWKATLQPGVPVLIETSPQAWTYAAQIPLAKPDPRGGLHWYWARLDVHVLTGQVGVAAIAGNDLRHEVMVPASAGPMSVFVRVDSADIDGIMIRNGALGERSRVRLFGASLERCARPS